LLVAFVIMLLTKPLQSGINHIAQPSLCDAPSCCIPCTHRSIPCLWHVGFVDVNVRIRFRISISISISRCMSAFICIYIYIFECQGEDFIIILFIPPQQNYFLAVGQSRECVSLGIISLLVVFFSLRFSLRFLFIPYTLAHTHRMSSNIAEDEPTEVEVGSAIEFGGGGGGADLRTDIDASSSSSSSGSSSNDMSSSSSLSSAEKGWPAQVLSSLDASSLTPLSAVVMHRQATINIGTIGHVAHGKSTVVKAISGVQTVRFKTELERNITIKLGYANAKIFKCDNPKCLRYERTTLLAKKKIKQEVPYVFLFYRSRPGNYRSLGSSAPAQPKCERPDCGSTMTLVRHVSFVDCPGNAYILERDST